MQERAYEKRGEQYLLIRVAARVGAKSRGASCFIAPRQNSKNQGPLKQGDHRPWPEKAIGAKLL